MLGHEHPSFMVLDDINIYDIGNTIQLAGAIWLGNGRTYFCTFPEDLDEVWHMDRDLWTFVRMNLDDWKKFIRQTDIMETEILAKDTEGKLVKAVLRKTQRQIEQGLQWRVFKRDNYQCRYCGIDGVPLTVDHVILWEEGGPTIEENLVTACRKCNKMRGNMQYETWLCSGYYLRKMKYLTADTKFQNTKLLETLNDIPRQHHIKSR